MQSALSLSVGVLPTADYQHWRIARDQGAANLRAPNSNSSRSGNASGDSPVFSSLSTATDDDIAFLSIEQAGEAIRSGLLSSVELTEVMLRRLDESGRPLNAVIQQTASIARRQAQQADSELQSGLDRGPLHGIPYGLKDVFSVRNTTTTYGSALFRDHMPTATAHAYKQLEEAGAVLVAKLATGEFGWGDTWFDGQTKNPWNPNEGACGSSSGPAVAVSAGLVTFALGSESWGSLSCPADRVGVTAHRASFGTVGRSGMLQLAFSLDMVGPICRSARDCQLVLSYLQGQDEDDVASVKAPQPVLPPPDVKSLTIGYTDDTHPEVKAVLEQTGATMRRLSTPLEADAAAIMEITLASEIASSFQTLLKPWMSLDDVIDRWRRYATAARLISAADYLQAQHARLLLAKEMHEELSGVDVVVGPSHKATDHSAAGNALGFPEATFPVAFEAAEDAPEWFDPVAQAAWGPLYSDSAVLAVVDVFQRHNTANLKRPPVSRAVRALCTGSNLPYCAPAAEQSGK